MIRIKRAYEPPQEEDGVRLLVERLWPRGIRKEALQIEAWLKEVAPSAELRRWFAHDLDKWPEFQRRYRSELDANPAAWKEIAAAAARGPVTLVYAARDPEHNSALLLQQYLLARGAGERRDAG